jgi:hypothetical protein
METERTCGKGLAEHSVLPAKLGELTAALAEILESHATALDRTDENARREYDAYQQLAQAQRKTAAELRAIAEQMAGYRDLPMGRHDEEAMAAPGNAAAFERFVAVEQELLALVQQRVRQDQAMLGEMHGTAGPA